MPLTDPQNTANGGARNVASAGRLRKAPARPPRRRGLLAPALAALLLGPLGCSGPGVEPDAATAAAPYPELASVPPRPRLSYTLEQRRQIADSLVADRENARYDRAVVRYELGLDTVPPPALRPPPVEAPQPQPGGVPVLPDKGAPQPLIPGGGALAEALVNQQLLSDRNNGDLRTFLRALEQQNALDRQMAAAGLIRPSEGVLTELPGLPPAEPAPPVQPPADAVAVRFAPGATAPSIDAEPALQQALAEARAAGHQLILLGRGASAALALERARAVAKWLVQLGAPADMLRVQGGGAGESVLVFPPPA